MSIPSICPVQHQDEGLSWGGFIAVRDSAIPHVGERGLTAPVGFAGKKIFQEWKGSGRRSNGVFSPISALPHSGE